MIKFTIHGNPIAQGSMKSIGKGRMISDNPRLRAWRILVATKAREAAIGYPKTSHAYTRKRKGMKAQKLRRFVCFDEPTLISVMFYLPITGKHKENEPHSTKPDLDKLQRAIGDALEAADIVSNDSRLCVWSAAKLYSKQPRVEIELTSMTEQLEGGRKGE